MFCYQCEQAANGTGCTVQGVCGKDPETAALQYLLLHATKGICMYADLARSHGVKNKIIDRFVIEALFTTITNVNFDAQRIAKIILMAAKHRDEIREQYLAACKKKNIVPETLSGPATWSPASDFAGLVRQGNELSPDKRLSKLGGDRVGLQELLLYGLKGMAAYADHAAILGQEDDEVFAFFHRTINFLTHDDQSIETLLQMVLDCGGANLKVMGLLDLANTATYGHPEPTKVRITPVRGKAILVSGHDLKDLDALLQQTEGKGINVYTHGEMLPCNAYPKLKKYKHLVGNYGGAWQNQIKEFDQFPGSILMTTNCIQRPQASYSKRIFTSGLVGWPGVRHIADQDFTPVIESALNQEGFKEDANEKFITVGFARNTVGSVLSKVVDAVKSGKVKHIFLIGGCDGAKPGRNYYTDFAKAVPADCLILTLACGKYRFNKLDFGEIAGLPRLLDVGQCNDAYSAIQIALALAKEFNCGVNELPLSIILSWYEQKAVCVLLTLLHLGIKNMRLGPSLPAFVTPNVLKILEEKFNLAHISSVERDLGASLE